MENEFLNPKSMLTPGIAGGMVMVIGQALANTMPVSLPITLMILSFLVGTLVLVNSSVRIGPRTIYYLLNSLFIFAMAVGISATASDKEQPPQPQQELIAVTKRLEDTQKEVAGLINREIKLREALAQKVSDKKILGDIEKLKHEAAVAQKSVDTTKAKLEQVKERPKPTSRFIKKVF